MGNSDYDSDCAEYGTALDPIEEDEVARKKPITVSEQVAVDEKGRRRFHGAFTGGFSAGYFNTVGSKEGWAPSTFKSSRADRGSLKSQNVLDFMDDEDKGAFGIAPQVLRPTDDFADQNERTSRKRPFPKEADGPIPGLPVLDQIIQPVKETIGIKILIKMGWRPGKGVGPKIDRRAKKPKLVSEVSKPTSLETDENEDVELASNQGNKVYGCSIPALFRKDQGSSDDSEDELSNVQALLAPDDVNSLLCNPKENSFGLGYKGLDRNTLTATSNDLFGSNLKFRVENKKMSISGQAFGVGAFEDHDEDIYSREDMTQYDFALETPDERRRRKTKEDLEKRKVKNKENCIDGFRIGSTLRQKKEMFAPPSLPANFQPFHSAKKSRFQSLPSNEEQEDVSKRGLNRHTLTISERQVLIEDDPSKLPKKKEDESAPEHQTTPDTTKVITTTKPPVQTDADIHRRIERLKKFTQVLQAYKTPEDNQHQHASFKPFMKNPEKQERYEKYLTLLGAGFSECLKDLQPAEMTEWELQREKMEFERASKLYKPMSSILSSRFTSAKSHDISHLEPEKEVVKEKDPSDDPKVAARLRMFGKLTHHIIEWHPDKLVCKRFNVPHPFPDSKFVGVRGDMSRVSKNYNSATTSSVVIHPEEPTPKKSLFDNLDFSKPPPGLLPMEFTPASSLQENPAESSGRGEISTAAKPVLEFHQQLSTSASANEDEESVVLEKPSLDLFKEIFADSSDSEDDEPDTQLGSGINQGKENESQHFSAQHMLRNDSERTDKTLDQIGRRGNDRKSRPLENESVNQTAVAKRGIFDRIDLDRLQGHERNRMSNEKFSNLPIPGSSGFGASSDGEDMEDVYGPLPPKVRAADVVASIPQSSSSSSTRNVSAIPPVSSGLENYKPPRKSDDTRKEANIEEVIWVEKSALSDSSSKTRVKKKKHSSKKSSKRSNKKEKRKSHKSKKSKHKKKDHKHKKKSKRDSSDSVSTSESDDCHSDSDASSDSSVTINDSLDNRALLAKLKQITRSN